jgi:hypothetical protein
VLPRWGNVQRLAALPETDAGAQERDGHSEGMRSSIRLDPPAPVHADTFARTRGGLPSPAASRLRDVPLLALALLAALSSVAALLLQWAGWVRMPFTITFVSLPGTLVLLCITVWAGRSSRELLFNRLMVGFIAGTLGLVAYDLMRLFVQTALPLGFDAFFSMRAFGWLMTGQPLGSPTALIAGWIYHVSNGLSFGVMYALLAGPARWYWGLLWGLILEAAMLVVYPAVFNPTPRSGFLLVSIVGHAAFGTIVGVWCARHATPALRGTT